MQMLKNICDMDLAKVKTSLEEFDACSLGDAMIKEIEPRPSEHGNRRQRRAAKSDARKIERLNEMVAARFKEPTC